MLNDLTIPILNYSDPEVLTSKGQHTNSSQHARPRPVLSPCTRLPIPTHGHESFLIYYIHLGVSKYHFSQFSSMKTSNAFEILPTSVIRNNFVTKLIKSVAE